MLKFLMIMSYLLLLYIKGLAGSTVHNAALYEIQQELVDTGFENVRLARETSHTVMVQYENRIFRNELLAAGVVLYRLTRLLDDSTQVVLRPLNRGIRICEIRLPLRSFKEFIQNKIDDRALARQLEISEGRSKNKGTIVEEPLVSENSSFRRVDLTLRPGTAIQLGNYDDRFKWHIVLLPELSTALWPGALFQMQVTIPLYDEIGVYTNEVRVSRCNVSQMLRLPGAGFASLSMGSFNPDRYGFAAQSGYFLFNRHFYFGSAVEYTGFLLYQNGLWNYSGLNKWNFRTFGYYYFDKIDLSIGVQYAEYLRGDKGWRVEANRVFTDAEICIYMAKTDIDRFGGIRLKIPLPPRRSPRPSRVRLMSPLNYQLIYQATTKVYTIGAPVETGISITPGPDILDFQKRLIPSYIRNNLDLWKKALRYAK